MLHESSSALFFYVFFFFFASQVFVCEAQKENVTKKKTVIESSREEHYEKKSEEYILFFCAQHHESHSRTTILREPWSKLQCITITITIIIHNARNADSERRSTTATSQKRIRWWRGRERKKNAKKNECIHLILVNDFCFFFVFYSRIISTSLSLVRVFFRIQHGYFSQFLRSTKNPFLSTHRLDNQFLLHFGMAHGLQIIGAKLPKASQMK